MTETYFDAESETMPRDRIAAVQTEALLDLLPWVYERSPLVRSTWDEAGVTPRDVRTLDDFRERVPFVSKDAVRRFRDERGDPYGGLLCLPEHELTAIMSTSGTTGDPTLVPERWGDQPSGRRALLFRDFWGMGIRPGDAFSVMLFTFRGPMYAFVQQLGSVPILFDYAPEEVERLLRLSVRHRPTGLYNLGGTLIKTVEAAAERAGVDPKDAFSSYKGVVFAGEPLGRRARALADEWGIPLFEHSSVGDVTASFECPAHDGMHVWEDTVVVEGVDPDTGAPVDVDGARCELVATGLLNRVAPLVRYRSDDLVRIVRSPCVCGRTHLRIWTLGRKGDEVVVDGKAVLPLDVWGPIEDVDGCHLGLFQLVRPQREMDVLRLRVGCAGRPTDALRDAVAAAVHDAVGLVPEVELVPDAALLRLGPPHKIPRVAQR